MRGNGRPRRPSVLFVNQHYHPDVASTGQHLTDLAEFLAAEGWDVEVLCGRGRYASVAVDAAPRERRNGVEIRRIAVTRFGRRTHLGRMLDYLTFYAGVLVRLLGARRRDCVVTLTTPPLLALCGALAKKLRGGRFGVWSMDLHPEIEIALGVLREGGLVTRLLDALDRLAYRQADFVVALDPDMARRVRQRGVPEGRLATIPVWNRRNEIRPVDRSENPLARELGVNGEFVVMYSGNAGLAHRFDEVLEAMRRLRDRPDVLFLFVGEGPRKREIVEFVRAHDIRNFRYLGYFPRERLNHSLSLADIHLVTQRREAEGSVFPSKLYGVMAASRPALFVGPSESEAARIVAAARCGTVVDPASEGAAEAVCETLLRLRGDRERALELGRNGRRAFLGAFEQESVCREWATFLRRRATVTAADPAASTAGHRGARPFAALESARGGRNGDRGPEPPHAGGRREALEHAAAAAPVETG